MSKELFKEAIADAKAVREAALANAKAALEEALTPKLQSMLAAKLQEIEEIDENKDEEKMDEAKDKSEEKMEEGMYPDVTGDTIQDKYRATGAALEEADEELEEDFDLSEILAELNDEKDEMKEAEDKEKMDEAEEEEEEEEEEEGDEEEEEVEVKDLTIEDLKDLIRDIVSQEVGTETPADEEEIVPVDAMSGEMGPNMGADEEEDEIDLEELLAELDSLDEADDKEDVKEIFGFGKKKQTSAPSQSQKPTCPEGEAKWSDGRCYPVVEDDYNSTKQIPRLENGRIIVANQIWSMEEANKKEDKEKMEEGIMDTIKKILGTECLKEYNADIKAGMDADKAGKKFAACMASEKGGKQGVVKSTTTGIAETEDKSELEEAIETIETLRTELNEVNLLNAKLLYVNKLFKAKNLTESQKLKVIASFDKATNVKEAKVVFESLESAINAPAKKAIKESLGFASKAVGNAPNKSIVESNDVIARMQKLANIK